MKLFQFFIIPIFFFIFFTACQFQKTESTNNKSQVSLASQKSPLTISYISNGKTISLTRAQADSSVTLPVNPPDEVQISGISTKLKPFTIPLENGRLFPLVSIPEGDVLRIFGFSQLSAKKMDSFNVYFSEDGYAIAFKITFRTPPDVIEATKLPEDKRPRFVNKLFSHQNELDYLYTISIRNSSSEAVEYHIPLKRFGELFRSETDYSYKVHQACHVDQITENKDQSLKTNFFLIPNTINYNDIDAEVAKEEQVVTLNPGENALYAVYVDGTGYADFYKDGYNPLSHSVLNIQSTCARHCPGSSDPGMPGTINFTKCVPGEDISTTEVLVGIDRSVIRWNLDEKDTILRARHANFSQADDPEMRELKFLEASQTLFDNN